MHYKSIKFALELKVEPDIIENLTTLSSDKRSSQHFNELYDESKIIK